MHIVQECACLLYTSLLDANGNVLQNVTPYKDAVTLDGEIYDGSMNQTTTALLLAVSAARE